MGEGGYRPIEKLDVFLTYESVTNRVWNIVATWPLFAKDTVGKQLVRSVDSIGANLVEGDGRGSDPDSIRFFRYARASARESRLWIQRATERGLIDQALGRELISEIEKGTLLLNNLIKFRKERKAAVKVSETVADYDISPLEVTEE